MNDLVISYETMAQSQNDRVLTHYFTELMLIARSIFEYEGLDELKINEKWIEKYLFAEGKCLFFEDPTKGFMVTALAPEGRRNYYNEPTLIRPYALGYTGKTLINGENCVVIKNNDMAIPTTHAMQLFAFKLAEIDRTISVNIQAQKTPVIIECSEKERQSMKNFMKMRNDNEPQIFISDKMNTKGITVHNLNTPMVFKELEYQKHMVWNEAMTYLGLNNANQDKRERLVANEVQANDEQVEACFNTFFSERENACNMINEIFGTHIKVKKRIKETPKLSDHEYGSKVANGSEQAHNEGGVNNG